MGKSVTLLAFFAVTATFGQPHYNLDFETITRGKIRGWQSTPPGYETGIETASVFQGQTSLRITRTTGNASNLGSMAIRFPGEIMRGKRVKVSGAIRTANITAPGYAAIWFRADSSSGVLQLRNMSEVGVRGTTEWRRYEYELDVHPNAATVILGVFLAGDGTAWFDDLRLEIDGQPLPQGEAPYTGEPRPDLLNWIRENAIPFQTDRAERGFADLQPLKPLIGNARVVGLGEATHGTAEFFRMKHRLMEFLAAEMGFTLFSIEANMPEAYLVNDYVLRGVGDPKRLLQGMYFWTWNTQEVLDLIEWMRRFNASGRGRVQFTGFDMQTSAVAGEIVRAFAAKADPGYAAELNAAYDRVEAARRLPQTAANAEAYRNANAAANAVRRTLESRYDSYIRSAPMAEVDWAIQNARVVEQAAHMPFGGTLHRDEMMAANTDWILQQNPGAKMAIWAHNYHVSRVAGAQGSHLAKWYGDAYLSLGFAFHEGHYSARVFLPNGSIGPLRNDNPASPSFPGSVEYAFHQTGLPRFILDLRKAQRNNGGAWLLGPNEFREIGAVAWDGFDVRAELTQDHDALIFFDQTTASALLPFN